MQKKRDLSEKDFKNIKCIFDDIFPKEENVFKLLKNSAADILYIEDKSFVIFLNANLDYSEVEILFIATKFDKRNKGYASILMEELKKISESIFLDVNETNISAITFYKKHGFTEIYRRKRYYANRDDAIVMNWRKDE